MFDSNVLEVAAGMIVCFASIALIASSLQEGLASLMRWRARTLLVGVTQLLNGNGLVLDIYNHALVNPRSDGKATSIDGISKRLAPSYIDPVNFARAMLDSLQKGQVTFANLRPVLVSIADPQVRQCLCGIYDRANLNISDFESGVAKWFDSAADRISGSYKRRAQLWTFIFALMVSVFFNIDTYHVMKSLWVVSTASMLHVQAFSMDQGTGGALLSLDQLPIGWHYLLKDQNSCLTAIMWAVPGWIVAATSALFGAPFWFGLLGGLLSSACLPRKTALDGC
jgi:hypothetical protein